MKPLHSSNKLVSSVNNTTSFKMETSAETFEIFSSQIYEHKARAIIRELSCNAHDAHVDAGKREVPFYIHFPTIFEPWFSVEDFGVGLDDYDIRGEEKVLYDSDGNEASRYMEGGIYTTYFASSKRESNESIGHLGLGSKSPMAYTKSMTVVARKDGVERHYVCFIGEDGQPQTTFNSEHETDQGNGVKVSFSVSANDFEEFRREAQFVISLFKVKPENNVEITSFLSDREVEELNTDGVLVISNGHPFVQHETATIYANMGGVVYPVRNIDYYYLAQDVLVNEDAYNTGEDDEAIYHNFDKATVSFIKNVTERSNRCIVVNFDIGELSFMPSREGLSQDTTTKLNLYKKLIDVFQSKVAELNHSLDKCRSPIEAINTFGEFSEPTDLFAFNYYYKGRAISDIINDRAFKKAFDHIFGEEADKLIYHYKGHVGNTHHARMKNKTCIRKNTIFTLTNNTFYELMKAGQKSFDCFYAKNEEDFKGLSTAIRFYMNNTDVEGERVLFFTTPVGPKVYKNVRDALYGNINFRHISELVDEVKAIEPNFFEKKKRLTSGRKVSKKNETKAVLCTYNKKDSMYKITDKQVLVNLDKLNHSNSVWVEKPTGLHGNRLYQINVNGSTRLLTEDRLFHLMSDFGIKVVVMTNGKNAGKIQRSGLPSLGELAETELNNNYDQILKNLAWTKLHSLYKTNDHDELFNCLIMLSPALGYNNRQTLNFLYESDVEFTKPMIDYVIEQVKTFRNDNWPTENCLNSLANFIDFSAFSEARDSNVVFHDDIIMKMNDAYNSVKNRYPLVFGVDEDKGVVLDYVEMINERNRQQMKVA